MWNPIRRQQYKRWLLMSMQAASGLAIVWLLTTGPVQGAIVIH